MTAPLKTSAEIKPKSKRGGARPGAGRKPKTVQALSTSFEAGERVSTSRGVLLLTTLNPRQELPGATRTEIMRGARHLYNNDPRATYIVEHIAQRAIGTGIVPQARGGNSQWCRAVERAFEDANCNEAFGFDAAAAVNFYGGQSLLVRQVAVDGDFFGQLVRSTTGRAMMRFIGAESCSGSEAPFFDGVRLGSMGQPLAYRIVPDISRQDDAVTVPVEDIKHFRHVRRAGYARGLSWLHAAVLDMRDQKEIKAFVKDGYKTAAQMPIAIKSAQKMQFGAPDSDLSNSAAQPNLSVEKMHNGILLGKLLPNEELQILKNEIPGSTFEPMMRFLISSVAFSFGIPPEAVMMSLGMTGTEQRALLEVAQNFLERIQQMVIDQYCRPFYKYWLWTEITSGRIPYPGDDWWRCDFIPPRKITVDIGREGRLYSDQLEKGHMSWERYCNQLSLDAEAEEDDIIATAVRRLEKCRALGLDPALVFPNLKPAAPLTPPPVSE